MAKNWHRAEVVAAVHKAGSSLAALARKNGLSDSALRAALSEPRRPSNLIIAKFLNTTLHALWPSWFDHDGYRIARRDTAPARRRPSSQKRRAA